VSPAGLLPQLAISGYNRNHLLRLDVVFITLYAINHLYISNPYSPYLSAKRLNS
jgi:hypothetical protein